MSDPDPPVPAREPPATPRRWTHLLVYRAERLRTTWKLRLAVVGLVAALAWLTGGWWTVAIGRSLVCDPSRAPSDVILLDNLEATYLLFERANRLQRAGVSSRVLVPIATDPDSAEPNDVAVGTAEVMARIARSGDIEIIPTRQDEPISLNAARDIQRFLERERIRSVILVTPLFRSRRSALVYGATLGRAGITVHCEPVQAGSRGVDTWSQTWHGIQEVVEQWLKLQYYRFYVLPFRLKTVGQRTQEGAVPKDGLQAPGGAARGTTQGIGTATMTADGTIILDLRAEGPGRAVGDARLVYPRQHEDYEQILEHVGRLSPGESKIVPPW